MTQAILIRLKDNTDVQSLGRFYLFDDLDQVYSCVSLELPDKDNERQISRIPAGDYEVKKRSSQKFGEHFHVTGVPGRDFILIHVGNFYKQTHGCILLGHKFTDVNQDGELDVVSSRMVMQSVLDKSPKTFNLKVIDADK